MKLPPRYLHGHTWSGGATRTYKAWCNMLARCYNRRDISYPNYGGRGITVSRRWRNFTAFLADMGECPSGRSLDRIKSNQGYRKGNCRWATLKEQHRNTRRSRWLILQGVRRTKAEWAERLGIPYGTIHSRLHRGWSIQRALKR